MTEAVTPDGIRQARLFTGSPTAFEEDVKKFGGTGDKYVFEYVMLPMKDGVRLQTQICRPRAAGRYPVVMERTPYKTGLHFEVYRSLLTASYVIIVQNERGTQWSEGDFGFLTQTAADAMETLTWIGRQDWSNGKVATVGCSSTAENQLVIGATGHPVLAAQVAMSSGAGIGNIPGAEGRNGVFYRGGVPMLESWVLWYSPFGWERRPKLPVSDDPDETARFMRNFRVESPDFMISADYHREALRSARIAPSKDALRRLGAPRSGFDRYITLGPMDEAWQGPDFISAEHVGATPAINVNGWLDIGAFETVKLFEFQQHHAEQYLIMAPTSHCKMTSEAGPQAWLGDRFMGNTAFPYDEVFLGWFNRLLTGDESAWKPMPKVQVFLMGADTWLTGERWPLPETEMATLYLASTAGANTLWGDGMLTGEPAAVSGPAGGADRFLADPANPVPTLGSGLAMDTPVVVDQRPVECRSDVLVYSTPVLDEGIAVAGDVEATLFVSADVPDTDIHVKLVDVYPDGPAYNVAETCLRLRYRDSLSEPAPLEPGKIYEVTIKGVTTANYFAPGHRMRIELAGSNFPNCDRNWNTGGASEAETAGPVATVTVHHDAARPSRITYRRYTGEVTVSAGHPTLGKADRAEDRQGA